MATPSYQLGRRHAPDPRDARYPLSDVRRLTAPPSRPYHYWPARFNLDQTGDTCTANGAAHALGDSPQSHTLTDLTGRLAVALTMSPAALDGYVSAQSGERGWRGFVYDRAQQIDEWAETPPEGGSSTRAVAEFLRQTGIIREYRWITTFPELIKTIIDLSPVYFGSLIYEGMYPPSSGVAPGGYWRRTGGAVGGHAYVLDGANVTLRKVRIQTWGVRYWMTFTDMEALFNEATTDAMVMLEP